MVVTPGFMTAVALARATSALFGPHKGFGIGVVELKIGLGGLA
jgi:hypothetical protein